MPAIAALRRQELMALMYFDTYHSDPGRAIVHYTHVLEFDSGIICSWSTPTIPIIQTLSCF